MRARAQAFFLRPGECRRFLLRAAVALDVARRDRQPELKNAARRATITSFFKSCARIELSSDEGRSSAATISSLRWADSVIDALQAQAASCFNGAATRTSRIGLTRRWPRSRHLQTAFREPLLCMSFACANGTGFELCAPSPLVRAPTKAVARTWPLDVRSR